MPLLLFLVILPPLSPLHKWGLWLLLLFPCLVSLYIIVGLGGGVVLHAVGGIDLVCGDGGAGAVDEIGCICFLRAATNGTPIFTLTYALMQLCAMQGILFCYPDDDGTARCGCGYCCPFIAAPTVPPFWTQPPGTVAIAPVFVDVIGGELAVAINTFVFGGRGGLLSIPAVAMCCCRSC